MNDSPLLALVHNASLLLAIALVYDVVADRTSPARHLQRQIYLGLLVGAIGVAVMLTPWQFVPGIVFDARSVLLAVSGRFFGPVVTVIAMTMTAAFRLLLGGEAAVTGVFVILASGCIGMAWRHHRRKRTRDVSFGEIYLLGIVVHVTMLALMFTLPWDTALGVVSTIGLPVLVIHPLATALLGALVANRRRGNWLVTQLRESEERLRLALSAANQGLWDLDLASGAGEINPSYATMLGYDPATFKLTFTTWSELLHPDDRERVLAAFRDYVEGRRPDYRVEFRMRATGGDWHWILSCGSIIERDQDGKPLRMIGTHTDITDRKSAEIENQKRLEELSRWYKVTLGRESRVGELKAEVNELRRRLGEPPGYEHAAGDRPAER